MHLALRIVYALAINWVTMSFPVLMLLKYYTCREYLLIYRLIDGLGPVDLVLFILFLELVILNLNVVIYGEEQ